MAKIVQFQNVAKTDREEGGFVVLYDNGKVFHLKFENIGGELKAVWTELDTPEVPGSFDNALHRHWLDRAQGLLREATDLALGGREDWDAKALSLLEEIDRG